MQNEFKKKFTSLSPSGLTLLSPSGFFGQLLQQWQKVREEICLILNLPTYRPIPEDRMDRIMKRLRLDWNFHSNSTEGNSLSTSSVRIF
ncbi:MAG: hypothetical protein MK212_13570 [Saprospiraceae bacterium]|nr:hypothetical protein [Saprospiraceae bacterium]